MLQFRYCSTEQPNDGVVCRRKFIRAWELLLMIYICPCISISLSFSLPLCLCLCQPKHRRRHFSCLHTHIHCSSAKQPLKHDLNFQSRPWWFQMGLNEILFVLFLLLVLSLKQDTKHRSIDRSLQISIPFADVSSSHWSFIWEISDARKSHFRHLFDDSECPTMFFPHSDAQIYS